MNTESNDKNKAEFETIMDNAAVKTDDYYDKNNPFVKIILLLLGLFIIGSVVWMIVTYMGS